jgi:ElaB/YqjD/DUF883 family membrane-anchored ribosome-binding protein
MRHTSGEQISEALEFLEEAATKKKDELTSVIADKYSHLRRVIVETESSIVNSLSGGGAHSVEAAGRAKDVGVEKARELACDVDKHLQRNPWLYLLGTAGIGLLLGYILGRNRK